MCRWLARRVKTCTRIEKHRRPKRNPTPTWRTREETDVTAPSMQRKYREMGRAPQVQCTWLYAQSSSLPSVLPASRRRSHRWQWGPNGLHAVCEAVMLSWAALYRRLPDGELKTVSERALNGKLLHGTSIRNETHTHTHTRVRRNLLVTRQSLQDTTQSSHHTDSTRLQTKYSRDGCHDVWPSRQFEDNTVILWSVFSIWPVKHTDEVDKRHGTVLQDKQALWLTASHLSQASL